MFEEYFSGDMEDRDASQLGAHLASCTECRRRAGDISDGLLGMDAWIQETQFAAKSRQDRYDQPLAAKPVSTRSSDLAVASRRSWFPAGPVARLRFAAIGLAAALLIVFPVTIWLALRNHGLQSQLTKAKQDQAYALEVELKLREQLAGLGQRHDANNTHDLNTFFQSPAGNSNRLVAINLKPSLGRSTADAAASCIISAQTVSVHATLYLEYDRSISYVASLRTPENVQILQQPDLRSQPAPNGGNTVAVEIPARLLTPGAYMIRLEGLDARKQREDVGDYYFQVARQYRKGRSSYLWDTKTNPPQ
jgi:hypothetical protein